MNSLDDNNDISNNDINNNKPTTTVIKPLVSNGEEFDDDTILVTVPIAAMNEKSVKFTKVNIMFIIIIILLILLLFIYINDIPEFPNIFLY